MTRTFLSALMMLTVVLSGCFGGGDDHGHDNPTAEECEALGLVLREKQDHSMHDDDAMDDGSMDMQDEGGEDNGTGGLALMQSTGRQEQGNDTSDDNTTADADDTSEPESMENMDAEADGAEHVEYECVEPGPTVTVEFSGLPETLSLGESMTLEWTLRTALSGEDHSHNNGIRVYFESVADDALPIKPEDVGDEVGKKEHQTFTDGTTFNATYTPSIVGIHYFRAYAVSAGGVDWTEESMLEVTEVQPTGITHDIECNNGGWNLANAECDPDPQDIGVGDGVRWLNGNPQGAGSWSISVTGPDGFSESTTAGGAEIVFLVIGSYSYTATGDLGSIDGTINVS